MLIGDIVLTDLGGAFVNDVQLNWYPSSPRNLDMVRAYMFSYRAPSGFMPSVAFVQRLIEGLAFGRENRYVAIANYGRGKTHLALAVANLFGMPAESEAVQTLLARIERVSEPAVARAFRDFKLRQPRHIVVRLLGDNPGGLSEQFVSALERALGELTGDSDTRLPFWFAKAETVLANLSGDQRQRADEFLLRDGESIDGLEMMVRERNPQAYGHCVRVLESLHGVAPNLGGSVSLGDAVRWVVNEYCTGEARRAGGLVVLFDDFSGFIGKYGVHGEPGGVTPLQDLLKGIADHPDRALFVAFGQHDPNVVARTVFRRADQVGLQNLERELTRLPTTNRHVLYSSLETVLESYLRPDADALSRAYPGMVALFEDATDDTMALLPYRYTAEAGWDVERFTSIVTRGCFPLHPLTTALFSSVELKEVINPRDVLGHVLEAVRTRRDQPAIVDGRPNWIYAIEIVDWYGEMLEEDDYRAYMHARGRIGPEAPQVHGDLLKAMLLFKVGGLHVRDVRFDSVMAHLSGHPAEVCRRELEDLQRNGYVQYDSHRRVYSFWSPDADPRRLETALARELDGKRLDQTALDEAIEKWPADRLRSVEVPCVHWGNRTEWACPEVLFVRPAFAVARISRMAMGFRLDQNGLHDGRRGVIVRLVAETDDDVRHFDQSADEVLDALGASPIPVVLALPMNAQPELLQSILEEKALRSWSARRDEFGTNVYTDAVDRRGRAISDGLKHLREWCTYRVPAPLRRPGTTGGDQSLPAALETSYASAYPCSPPGYCTQRLSTSPSLRKAVGLVCGALVANRVHDHILMLEQDPVARDLYQQYVRPGRSGTWGLVSASDQIVEPTDRRTRHAWDALDRVFPPGTRDIKLSEGILPLLNPPYGYDYNQVLLLFCAWFGFHRRDLELLRKGVPCQPDAYSDRFGKPRELLGQWLYVDQLCITRRDPAEEERGIRELIADVRDARTTFSRAEAEAAAGRLRAYDADPDNHAELRNQARTAAAGLDKDRTDADAFAGQAEKIRGEVERGHAVGKLVEALKSVGELPVLHSVMDGGWPTADQLRASVVARLRVLTDEQCASFERLSRIQDLSLHEARLGALRKEVERTHQAELTGRVDAAVERLRDRGQELQARQHDVELLARVRTMRDTDPIATIRANLEHLAAMEPRSDEARNEIAATRSQMERVLGERLAWASGLVARVDPLASVEAVENMKDSIVRSEGSFDGSPEAVLLASARDRCVTIATCLRSLEALSTSALGSPCDVARLQSEVDALADQYGTALSDQQRALCCTARRRIEDGADAARQRAVEWLDRLEGEAPKTGSPEALLADLRTPRAFLPTEESKRIEQVGAVLEGRIEEARRVAKEREQKRRDQEEAKRRDSMLAGEVRLMSEDAQIELQREWLRRLGQMEPTTAAVRDLIQRRSDSLARSVATAVTDAASFAAKLDSAVTARAVRSVRSAVERAYDRYKGAPEAANIDAVLARCEDADAFLSVLESVRPAAVQSPCDAEALRGQVCAALATYEGTTSQPQRDVADGLLRSIGSRVAAMAAEAREWLEERARSVDVARHASELPRDLDAPPACLPAELEPRLEALRAKAQAVCDADEVDQVVSRFRSIRDPGKRQTCLDILARIAAGEEP